MVILSSALPTRTATAGFTALSRTVSHMPRRVSPVVPVKYAEAIFTPPISSALSNRLVTLEAATCALISSSSLARALFSAITASARTGRAVTLLAFRVFATVCSIASCRFARISRLRPVTASMRRMPAATEASLTILKPPIWAVFFTWVPPQNSVDQPSMSTTRTTLPYFSPNRAIAPSFLASSMGISRTVTFMDS